MSARSAQMIPQRWLEVDESCFATLDDVVHAATLSGLKDQLTQAGDRFRTHVAAVCEWELLVRLGLEAGNGAPRPGWGLEPR
jgi:hypothetical protein